MSRPLSHIRVLDLSRILAAPWASQILADLGADVIKVERPGVGDDTRTWGPPFLKANDGTDVFAGYFLATNRGKRSIAIDLSKPEGQALVRTLASQCDVVLENYKTGTLERYGLGWKDLSAVNPKLVYCSVTGFGQSGPRAAEPAYDFLIQAMGGMMSVTGLPDGEPGGGPQKVGVPIVDLVTGVYAATAIAAALAGRAVSGEGAHIDLAMLDVGVGVLANQAMNTLLTGKTPRRSGNAHPNIQPQNVYACKDGYLILVVGNDGQFASLCDVLSLPDLPTDERYRTNGARVRNQATLQAALEAALLHVERAEWLRRLAEAGVPAGPINSVPEALDDPQVAHRGMVRRYEPRGTPPVFLVMSPFRFSGQALNSDKPPPLLGEHTDQILAEAGVSDADVARMREQGTIG